MDESLRVHVADFGLARVVHDLTTLTGGRCCPAPTEHAVHMQGLRRKSAAYGLP